jgi:hypothetical protein
LEFFKFYNIFLCNTCFISVVLIIHRSSFTDPYIFLTTSLLNTVSAFVSYVVVVRFLTH